MAWLIDFLSGKMTRSWDLRKDERPSENGMEIIAEIIGYPIFSNEQF